MGEIMGKYFDDERREYVRIGSRIPVQYKFLSVSDEKADNTFFEGETENINGVGIFCTGPFQTRSM